MADVDVQKFAGLARIYITDEEAEKLKRDFEGILGYISKLEDSGIEAADGITNLWDRANSWREDDEPHEAGEYTKELLAEVPSVENNRIRVKKIL